MDAGLALLLRLLTAIGTTAVLSLILGRGLLRLDRRGAWIVGGVCAGIALGPAGFGRIAPDAYESVMIGGVPQDRRADEVERRIGPELAAMAASGVSTVASDEHGAQLWHEVASLRNLADADRALRLVVASSAAASCVLLAGLAGGYRRGIRGDGLAGGVVAGLVAGVVALLLWAVASRVVLGADVRTSVAIGGAMAGGAVLARGMPAVRWQGLGALAAALLALGAMGGTWAAAALGVMLCMGWALRWLEPVQRNAGHGVMPTVCLALAAALVLPLASGGMGAGGWVFVASAALLAGDAQLIGAWFGVKIVGRGWVRERPAMAWLLTFGRGGAGWQLGLLVLAVATGALEIGTGVGTSAAYGVAAAAVASEVARPTITRSLLRLRGVSGAAIRR